MSTNDPLVVTVSNRQTIELVRDSNAIKKAVEKLACDLSTTCPQCDTKMEPEHAHYKCPRCHYRDSCCF